jgi:hypothetical protein
MDARAEALHALVTLARQHGLTADEIVAALGAQDAAGDQQSRTRHIVVRVLGYLGGTFVFAGVGVFIALQWDWMGPAARIVITLGSGLAACVLALVAHADARYEKAATPLFLVAAALEPTGMLVAFGELGSGGDWRWAGLATCATMALQFGAVFASLRQSVLLFLSVSFAVLGAWSALDLLQVDGGVIALVLGATLLLASAGVDSTPWRSVTGVWYLIGGAAALAGLVELVERTALDLLFLAAAAGLVYGHRISGTEDQPVMFGSRVKLDKALLAKLKRYSDLAGYASVEEFITHALEKEIAQLEGTESEQELKKKLKGLGYLS